MPVAAGPVLVDDEDIIGFNIYFNWRQVGVGFGQLHISKNSDGTFTASTETMSRSWSRAAILAAVDTALKAVDDTHFG